MAKFNVFEYNRMLMSKFGIYPMHLNEPSNDSNSFNSPVIYHFLFAIPITIILSTMGIWKNFPNIELVLQGIIVTIAGIQLGGMYLSILLNLNDVKKLHLVLQDIVDKG